LVYVVYETVYPTVTPTPGNYEYVIATGCVSSLLILLLGTMAILIYLLWYQHQRELQAPYRHETSQELLPVSNTTFTTPPSSSFTSGSTMMTAKAADLTATKYAESIGMASGKLSGSTSSLTYASKHQQSYQHGII
jgi:hypothetical protein